MTAKTLSADARAELIDDLLAAHRERERLLENHQLAPSRGINSHRFPAELAVLDRQIREMEAMLR